MVFNLIMPSDRVGVVVYNFLTLADVGGVVVFNINAESGIFVFNSTMML